MRRGAKRTKYARRERDTPYMMAVKALPCAAVSFDMPWPIDNHTPCSHVVEADHMGDRGRGKKAADDTCVPMCSRHHAERGDHTGRFRHATKDQLRTWRATVIAATQKRIAYLKQIADVSCDTIW